MSLQPKQALANIKWAYFGAEQVHRVWWHFTWEWHRSHSTRWCGWQRIWVRGSWWVGVAQVQSTNAPSRTATPLPSRSCSTTTRRTSMSLRQNWRHLATSSTGMLWVCADTLCRRLATSSSTISWKPEACTTICMVTIFPYQNFPVFKFIYMSFVISLKSTIKILVRQIS